MPVTNYVNPNARPPSTQLNYREMIGQITAWNPDVDPLVAGRMLNDAYRRIIDFRLWYGLVVKGQVVVPNAYSVGTVSLTNGSTTVTGTGVSWVLQMVGRQFRSGFSFPIYTIASLTDDHTIDLDVPWGGPDLPNAGYQIFQNIVSPHPNLKKVLAMVNQKQGYRLKLNVPQEVINIYDTWRTTTGWTYLLADGYPSADGQPQFELYPAPTFQQAFPFLGYVQPQDMKEDKDFPVLFIRSDVIVLGALPDALLFRGKNSKYYDPQTASYKGKQFEVELQKMAMNDNNLLLRDLIWEFEKFPMTRFGATWMQSHDID